MPNPASSASSVASLVSHPGFVVCQRKEGLELALGIETANSYDVHDFYGRRVLRVAEREGGFWNGVARQFGGHTLSQFELDVLDENGRSVLHLSHPPRWLLQRIEVRSGSGRTLGWFEQCFTLADRKFQIHDAWGRVAFVVDAGFFSSWSFPIARPNGEHVAEVKKEWSGLLTEAFTDADRFRLTYQAQRLTADERALLLAATIFIDLTWFEKNAND